MAKPETVNETPAPASDAPAPVATRKPRERKLDENGNPIPRVKRPIHVLFRVTGPDGQPIEGASLQVVLASNDPEKVVEAMDQNPGVSRTKVSL